MVIAQRVGKGENYYTYSTPYRRTHDLGNWGRESNKTSAPFVPLSENISFLLLYPFCYS